MKPSKQRKIAKAICANKALHAQESSRITAIQKQANNPKINYMSKTLLGLLMCTKKETPTMKLRNILLDECGQVTTTDNKGNVIFLQMPLTSESQNMINGLPLSDDNAIAYAKLVDDYYGQGDITLARLCYAGGIRYESYAYDGDTIITNTGDTFRESPFSQYYNVELYEKL